MNWLNFWLCACSATASARHTHTSTRLLLQHELCINFCTRENLWKFKEPTLSVWLVPKWTSIGVNKTKNSSFDLEISSVTQKPPPPTANVSLLRLSSPDAGSPRSHRRPRRCWPGPLLRPGSPGHPHRRRCKGLRRPGWGPCTPARRGPSRPPACTSGRPGRTGPPWRWTQGGGGWRSVWRWKQRGGGVRAGVWEWRWEGVMRGGKNRTKRD